MRIASSSLVIGCLAAFTIAAAALPAPGDESAGAPAAVQAIRYRLPSLGDGAPGWARRIEVGFALEKFRGPGYSILTVQPLHQGGRNTIFVQGSQSRYTMSGSYRDTTGAGAGYRRLFLDDSLLAGLNSAFDQEWTHDHHRMSLGGELRWGMLDLYANRYFALTGNKTVGSGVAEKALGGNDIEVRLQVPYLPWLRIGAKGHYWHARGFDDIRGWSASADADLTRNIWLEAGANDDNTQPDPSAFIKVSLRLSRPGRPALESSPRIGSRIVRLRDMMTHALDKVRRQEEMLCQDQGVVASAGSGPPAGFPNGTSCVAHIECSSNLCVAGTCTGCTSDADCYGLVCNIGTQACE